MISFKCPSPLFLGLILLLFVPKCMHSQAVVGINGGISQSNFLQLQQSTLEPIGSFNSGQGGIFLKSSRPNHLNMGVEINYRRKSDELSVYNSTGLAYSNQLIGHFRLDYASIVLLP